MASEINEKTKVPLFAILALLGVVATGGVVWGQTASRVYAVEMQVNAIEQREEAHRREDAGRDSRLDKNETTQQHVLELLKEIREDVKTLKRR